MPSESIRTAVMGFLTGNDEAAITAIHQGSGGLLRKANHFARGALIAAVAEKAKQSPPSLSALPPPKCFQ